MGRERLIYLASYDETFEFGRKFAQQVRLNRILAISGDLGAGKTTFVQGLADGLGIKDIVQSPTFVTLNVYEGAIPLYHFDLYRLKSRLEFSTQGFEEYFRMNGICAIEWPDIIAELLPPDTLSITFSHNQSGRTVSVSTWDRR